MKKFARIMAILLVLGVPMAATAGDSLANSKVEASFSGEHNRYLGLDESATAFRLSDIKAELLLINLFSLYCSPCQRDAADFNEMYEKVQAMGLGGRIKFLGVAAGNTVREMEYWRKRFSVPFPLVPDQDYALHKTFGSSGTPLYVLVRVVAPDQLEVVYTREGALEDKDGFFATVLSRAGVDVPVKN